MLKRVRIVLAALCLVGITLLFVGIGHDWWGWLAKFQLVPATLRIIGGATLGNIAVVLCILLIAFLFGRIYCSVICPLGVFQDVVIWLRKVLGKRIKPLRKKFNFNKERRWVRYPVAAAFIACIIVDLQLIVSLLGPYSAYGRMVTAVVGGGPAPLLIAAVCTFLVIGLSAWIWGRAWCSNICPVGTVLGCISKYSLFGIKIDTDKCVKCGACEHICKASCLDSPTRSVDRSRCIDCFDCIDFCKVNAIKFGRISSAAAAGGEAHDEGRRAFLNTSAVLVGGAVGVSAAAQEMKVDGGLAPVEPKTPLEREPRLVPPGAESVKNFYDHCTACQLCVQNCPNGVLRPSIDLNHFLQPQMGYENGFCRPECTVCSDICPAGAIRPLAREAKTLVRIGTAAVNPELCLAAKGEAGCGHCAQVCPSGAISMVTIDVPETQGTDSGGAGGNASRPQGEQADSNRSAATTGRQRRPVIAEEQCIGCGKCEYLCPSRPVSAITVKGLETHISK